MNCDRRQMIGTLAAFALGGCSTRPDIEKAPPASPTATMKKDSFGKMPDGTAVDLFTLTNANGVSASITTYGGRVVSFKVPDKKGTIGDIVLGFDTLDGYLAENPYFGALIGRYGNRIGKAQFTLDGKVYKLTANDGPNSLHGGKKGFDKVLWTSADVSTKDTPALELRYISKDMEEGYPGALACIVTYSLTPQNELKIEYKATTSRNTVLNLTNHSYWNLAGAGEGDILGHQLMIAAGKFTPVDKTLIPTGELKSLDGSPLDFRKATAIGERIDKDDEQLKFGKGYDHNYCIDAADGTLKRCAIVTEPSTGRTMEVLTTQPGVQFYTGNFLDGTLKGKGGKVYAHRSAFCLETQHFPDSPNKPEFPTSELKPGEEYKHTTVYKFSSGVRSRCDAGTCTAAAAARAGSPQGSAAAAQDPAHHSFHFGWCALAGSFHGHRSAADELKKPRAWERAAISTIFGPISGNRRPKSAAPRSCLSSGTRSVPAESGSAI